MWKMGSNIFAWNLFSVRRLPDDEPYGEMEELGKILASPDEKLKLDAERI